MSKKQAVLIYDGACPVCSRTVAWIRDNMRKDAIEMLSCQEAETRERFPGIDQAVCMEAMQLVLPDGSVLSGEKALPEILKRLKRFSPAAALFRLPGSDVLSKSFYRWFADNRYHIADVFFPKEDRKQGKT